MNFRISNKRQDCQSTLSRFWLVNIENFIRLHLAMILMLCSIWYHLHKLKKREKPSGGVLLLVKLKKIKNKTTINSDINVLQNQRI